VTEYKRVLIYTDIALMRGWKEAGNIQEVGIQEAGMPEAGIDEARMQQRDCVAQASFCSGNGNFPARSTQPKACSHRYY
jgi:hypothetical protein